MHGPHSLVIRPVSVRFGKFTTPIVTHENQRKNELTNNKIFPHNRWKLDWSLTKIGLSTNIDGSCQKNKTMKNREKLNWPITICFIITDKSWIDYRPLTKTTALSANTDGPCNVERLIRGGKLHYLFFLTSIHFSTISFLSSRVSTHPSPVVPFTAKIKEKNPLVKGIIATENSVKF